jgi:hypothetical protein
MTARTATNAPTADASLRSWQVALAVGSYEGAPLSALGIVALAGGAWHSRRGGTIDSLIRLDIALHPAGEGGALVDVQEQVSGRCLYDDRGNWMSPTHANKKGVRAAVRPEPVSGNSRTRLPSPETEIGKKRRDRRPKPASKGRKCQKLPARDRRPPA